jgi:single-stranded-DNA-specific exonuclease
MKKWQVERSEIPHSGIIQSSKFKVDNLIKALLANRGIKTKKEIESFLNPKLSEVTIQSVKINKIQIEKAIRRIEKAIKNKEKIIVFGDYDVDGVCGSAILWETLNSKGADVLPYIPSRFDEGYGLSMNGISNLKSQISNVKLIITVDNGIVAHEAVDFANKNGIDVIITDHHVPSKKLPDALAIVHTTALCGAGVAWLLAQKLGALRGPVRSFPVPLSSKRAPFSPLASAHSRLTDLRAVGNLSTSATPHDNSLELVALATIADLVPLTGANRVLVYFGIQKLRETKRPGLLALINKAGIKKEEIDTYEIGHILAPRLNAMGRLASAMDSLRLICTKDEQKAENLAEVLNQTNLERQQITQEALLHAKSKIGAEGLKNLIFIADESYQQGIVGLVAGRMVEEYYLPSIIISKGEKYSKASARSVKGFNIVEFLRSASDLLVDVGGHPMAAGFTVETSKLELLEKKLFENARKLLKKKHLERYLRIDCELDPLLVNYETYSQVQKLAPFGMANPEPTFLTKNLVVSDVRIVGKDGKHLKLKLIANGSSLMVSGIAFGMGEKNKLKIEDKVDVVYTMENNDWNGYKNIELKIKDLK